MSGHSSPVPSAIRSWRRWIGLILAGFLLLSCSALPFRRDSQRGIYHRVKQGETLMAIARAYHVNMRDLIEINRLDNPDLLEVDSAIFIPDVSYVIDNVLTTNRNRPGGEAAKIPEAPPAPKKVNTVATAPKASHQEAAIPPSSPVPPPAPKAPLLVKDLVIDDKALPSPPPPAVKAPVLVKDDKILSPPPAAKAPVLDKDDKTPPPPPAAKAPILAKDDKTPPLPPAAKVSPPAAPANRGRFIWPVKGKVISRFGDQPNQMRFNGIRIAAPDGTPILAAAGGLVIYAAYLKGYGETLIIEHEDDYATVYTNLETRTIGKGYRVRQGDRIAFLGKNDNQDETYLHFEIRHKYQARNPLTYLP